MTTDPPDGQPARIAFSFESSQQASPDRAAAWAAKLGLPLVKDASNRNDDFDFFLTLTSRRLELREARAPRSRPLYVDFATGPTAHRRGSSRGRKELIARAVGIRPNEGFIVDATAGLARDTFQLAAIGYTVVAIERSPILAALVDDAIDRARRTGNAALARIVERVTLRVGDSRDLLPQLSANDPPDVVYLDPMFTAKSKGGLPGKEIRICRRIVGDDLDAADLLSVAMATARRRTVVKRHAHAPPLHENPDISFKGRSVRYDVYLPQT